MGDRKIPEALYQCEDCEIDCPEASCRPASDLTWVNDRLVCDDCYDTNYASSEYERFNPDSARITTLEAALADCLRHMKTAGDPEAVRAARAGERVLARTEEVSG